MNYYWDITTIRLLGDSRRYGSRRVVPLLKRLGLAPFPDLFTEEEYKGRRIGKPLVIKVSRNKNPFVTFIKQIGYKFHPFIDASGVHGRYEDEIKLDYFGFRNDTDLYFQKKDYILVVMTGGSEAAGYSHRITIAENLERLLNNNKGGEEKFKVLNLAMNSYSLSNEINSYVNLAYHLKPEFVIAYTGANDLYGGIMGVPYPFKKLGLFYMEVLERWLPRLYYLEDSVKLIHGFYFDEDGYEIMVDAFLKNVQKYGNIVHSNRGKLIVGIQAINQEGYYGLEHEAMSERFFSLYEELVKKTTDDNNIINFNQIENIKFVDHVHSTEQSSAIIAEIYAKIILDFLQNSKKSERSNYTASSVPHRSEMQP